MMGFTSGPEVYLKLPYYLNRFNSLILVVAILCSTPIFKNVLNRKNLFVELIVNIILAALFVMCVSELAVNTYNPFIYFRF